MKRSVYIKFIICTFVFSTYSYPLVSEANVFESGKNLSQNIVQKIYCTITQVFGKSCVEDTTPIIYVEDNDIKKPVQEPIVRDFFDPAQEDTSQQVSSSPNVSQEPSPLVIYQTPQININGLTWQELENRLLSFKQELTPQPTAVSRDYLLRSTERVLDNTRDRIANSVSGGSTDFSGTSLSVSGTATASSFIGDGSQLTGLGTLAGLSDLSAFNIYHDGGNVGIGTSAPGARLTIFQDTLESGWPFVFEGVPDTGMGNFQSWTGGFGMRVGEAEFGHHWDFMLPSSRGMRLATHDVLGTNDAVIQAQSTGSGTASWGIFESANLGGAALGTAGNYPVTLYTNRTRRLTIDTTGNVGIGTTNPPARLSVTGSGTGNGLLAQFADSANTPRFTVLDNGNVGIGTTNPAAALTIGRTIGDGTGSYTKGILFMNTVGAPASGMASIYADSSSGYNGSLVFATDGDSVQNTNLTERMRILHNGNVGIGTTDPGVKLHINNSTNYSSTLLITSSVVGTIPFAVKDTSGNEIMALGLNPGDYNFRVANGTTFGSTGIYNNMSFKFGGAYITGENVVGGDINGIVTKSAYGLRVRNAANSADAQISAGNALFSGNVGIGTTLPSGKLEVSGGSPFEQILMNTDNTDNTNKYSGLRSRSYDIDEEPLLLIGSETRQFFNYVYIGGGSGGSNTATALRFYTASSLNTVTGTERLNIDGNGNFNFNSGGMYIQGGGNVGIGTTTPTAKLSVTGSGTGNGLLAQFADSANTPRFTVLDNGNVGIGTTNPGASLSLGNSVSERIRLFDAGTVGGSYGLGISAGELQMFSGSTGNISLRTGGYGSTTRMLINGLTGNVGIGTAPSGNERLSLYGDTGAQLVLSGYGSNPGGGASVSSGELKLGSNASFQGVFSYDGNTDGDLFIDNTYNNANGDIFFRTQTSGTAINALTIKGGGNVGIGTTDPSQKLHVAGNARFESVGSGAYAFELNLTADGTLTTSASDERLKTNIQSLDASSALDKMLQLNPSTFDWKSTGSHDIGLIAQEVEAIFPELVFVNPTDGYKGVNYSRFIPIIIASLQELVQRINGFAERFETKELCLEDVCITKTELQQLLNNQQVQSVSNTSTQENITEEEPVTEDVVEEEVDTTPIEQSPEDQQQEVVEDPVEELIVSDSPIQEEAPSSEEIIEEPQEEPVIEEVVEEKIEESQETEIKEVVEI